jgi:hypothetical protein
MSKTKTATTAGPKKRLALSGPLSLFRNKIRAPVSITLTARHHRMVNAAMARLGLTRADLLGLLIEKHADVVELPRDLPTPDED